MQIVTAMLVRFVYYLILVVDAALFARAILGWIMPDAEGVLITFLYAITEPFIAPVRTLLYRLHINTEGPLDVAFFVTAVLLAVLGLFFGAML